MGRDPVKNRANVARHKQRRKERARSILMEFTNYVKREPFLDENRRFAGFTYRVLVPEDFYQRFEELAREHGMTAQRLIDEAMAVYLDEVRRLKDEQN